MGTFPSALSTARGRRIPLAVPLVALVLLALIALGNYLASERYVQLIAAGLLFVQVFIVLRHWRMSVYLLFVYVIVEGFIINYFGGRGELNLIKDGLLITVFLALLFRLVLLRQTLFAAAPWKIPLAGFGFLYVLQVFNPALPSIVVGLIGLRVTLLFMMCALIGYWFFYRRETLRSFLLVQTLVSLPISVFGILQYFMGPAWMLSISPGFDRAIFYAGGRNAREVMFRTFSTFASTAGFSNYLWVTVVLTYAMFRIAKNRTWKLLAIVAMVLQGIGMLTAGGRSTVVWIALSFVIATLLMRRLRTLVSVVTISSFVFLLSLQLLGGVIQGRFRTLLDLDMVTERNIPLVLQLSAAMKTPPEGMGAGRLSSASYRWATNMDTISVENQLAKARYESGIAGLVLFVMTFLVMAFHIVLASQRLRDPELRTVSGFLGGTLLCTILMFPLGLPLDVPPLNFFFWFQLGMFYALVRIERMEQAELQMQERDAAPAPSSPVLVAAQ